jgi:hypothetical protein
VTHSARYPNKECDKMLITLQDNKIHNLRPTGLIDTSLLHKNCIRKKRNKERVSNCIGHKVVELQLLHARVQETSFQLLFYKFIQFLLFLQKFLRKKNPIIKS